MRLMTYEECVQFLAEQAIEIRDASSNGMVAAGLIGKYYEKLADDVAVAIDNMEEETQKEIGIMHLTNQGEEWYKWSRP